MKINVIIRIKTCAFFILGTLLCKCATGQSDKYPEKKDLTKAYSVAMDDFIKALRKKNIRFDSLFVIKRMNGQPDDFPDIALPEKISNVAIRLIASDSAEKSQMSPRLYVNLLGWVNKKSAEFIFVVFSSGLAHQYDYKITYRYHSKNKVFELKKVQLKEPPLKAWK